MPGERRDDPIVYVEATSWLAQRLWLGEPCPLPSCRGTLSEVSNDIGTLIYCAKGCGKRWWVWQPV